MTTDTDTDAPGEPVDPMTEYRRAMSSTGNRAVLEREDGDALSQYESATKANRIR